MSVFDQPLKQSMVVIETEVQTCSFLSPRLGIFHPRKVSVPLDAQ